MKPERPRRSTSSWHIEGQGAGFRRTYFGYATVGRWSARVLAAGALLAALAAPATASVVKGTVTARGGPFGDKWSAADAVVILHGAPAEPSAGRAVIDQRDLRFTPRVLIVAPGTTVEFPNHDNVHHNVRSRSAAQRFDLGLYGPGETRSTVFEHPGVVEIGCSAHAGMEGWVVVSDSPYFGAVTAQGSFEIDAVPAGQYDVEVWHPDFEPVRRPLTVPPDVPVLSVSFDLREERKQ